MKSAVCNTDVKRPEREKLQKKIDDYLTSGGEIQQIPRGVSASRDYLWSESFVIYNKEHMDRHKMRGPGIRINPDKGDRP